MILEKYVLSCVISNYCFTSLKFKMVSMYIIIYYKNIDLINYIVIIWICFWMFLFFYFLLDIEYRRLVEVMDDFFRGCLVYWVFFDINN